MAAKGPFKCYVTQMWVGGGGVKFSGKKRYEGVRFNVIGIARGWVGVQFLGKKRRMAPKRASLMAAKSVMAAKRASEEHASAATTGSWAITTQFCR